MSITERPPNKYRRDGSLKPTAARSQVSFFIRSLGFLNPADFTRQDTDNLEIALHTVHRILERQNRRKIQAMDADQTSPTSSPTS